MKAYLNDKVSDWLIRQVAKRLGQRTREGAPHASELYQCWRKTWYQRHQPKELTQEQIINFALGFALQEWFYGTEDEGQEIGGVVYSTDWLVKGQVMEFKSTSKAFESLPKDAKGKGIRGADKVQFDIREMDSWVDRTRAYCAVHQVNKAHVSVFFIYGKSIHTWTLEFTDEELAKERLWLDRARDAVALSLTGSTPPPVKTRRYAWECGYCDFKEQCLPELVREGMDG